MHSYTKPIIIGGPCSVESKEQLMTIAREVKSAGAEFLRGGAYKPRTRSGSFEGLGEEGLKYLSEVREETGLKIVTELMSERDIELFQKYNVDIVQIGARNMQNFSLLNALAKTDFTVLLKRGPCADFNEIEGAIERLENNDVILALRGTKIMKTNNEEIDSQIKDAVIKSPYQKESYRHYVDIEDIARLKESELIKNRGIPVIYDPSHACGIAEDVKEISLEAINKGADGLIIEVHNDPQNALSDSKQQILPEGFREIVQEIKK